MITILRQEVIGNGFGRVSMDILSVSICLEKEKRSGWLIIRLERFWKIYENLVFQVELTTHTRKLD